MSSFLSSLSSGLNELNNIQKRNNYINSRYSLDPKERELFSTREFCNNKFNWFRLKKAFNLFILPILLLVIIAYFQFGNVYIYSGLILWTVVGITSLTYLNYKYSYVGFKINNSPDISIDNCGF